MLERIPEGALREWEVEFEIDPWDERRADLRSAIVASLLDAQRCQIAKPRPPKEYMPYREETKRERAASQTPAKRTAWSRFTALWNKR